LGVVVFKEGALGNVKGRMWGGLAPVAAFFIVRFRRFHFDRNSWSKAAKMLSYGLPLIPYLLLGFIYNNIDKFLLEQYYVLSVLGLYGFAFLIVSIVEIFINALQSATYPTLFRELNKPIHNSETISEIYSLFILSNLTIVVAIASFGGIIIKLFIGEDYSPVISYLPLLAIMAIPRIFSIIYNNTLIFYKKTKAMPLASAASVIGVCILGILLIPYYGVFGLIVAVIISQTIQLLMFIYLTAYFKIAVPETKMLKKEKRLGIHIALAIIAATLLYNYYYPSPLWYLLILLVYSINLYVFFRGLLKKLWHKIFRISHPVKVH
jgi:O-antigen/teichoic acid export membrane protein